MKATKITNADIAPLRLTSLPSRPTAPKAYGGLGYTAAQMKAAFDAFPMFLANKFNALMTVVDGNVALNQGTVSAEVVKTGKQKKIIVFKYKAKKNYRRRQGHRQPYTKLVIKSVKA